MSRLGKLFEWRKYTINPKDFPSFLKLTNEHISLRTNYSPLLGYWITEIGGVNEVIHLWEYDNLDQRQQIRLSLAQDQPWNENYMAKMRPMLQKQENLLLRSVSDINTSFPTKENGVFLVEGSFHEPYSEICSAQRVGVFRSIHGEVSRAKYLTVWRHESMESLDERVMSPMGTTPSWTKVALPTLFSPLK
mmetsp:Transcript_37603/g.52036  ORF Transcript_37603/g.52036 Transcript_37603/m.52036 type:complete len:191 (-) Transcript_37603:104-676(-)